MISQFASSVPTVIPHAERLTTVVGIPITNSMLLGWVVSFLMAALIILGASRAKLKSSGFFVTISEIAVDGISNLADNIMHNREKANKYTPFLVTLFLFIMFNNWAGMLPGVGSITYHNQPL